MAPIEAAPKLTATLIRRDRRIEALIDMFAARSREYRRIARELAGASIARRERSPHRPYYRRDPLVTNGRDHPWKGAR